MMGINKSFWAIIFIIGLCACDDDALPNATLEDNFVRFSFQVDANNDVLEFPDISPSALELDRYVFSKRDSLKIPVVASSNDQWGEKVIVEYAINTSSDFINDNFIVLPANQTLEFTKEQPSDTIIVVPGSRFENINEEQMTFQLTSVSNPLFSLGYPRKDNALDTFTLEIDNTEPISYTLEEKTFNLNGNSGESIMFNVLFDQLISQEDIEGLDFISTNFVQFICDSGIESGFDFEIEQLPIINFTKTLGFKLTLLEDAPNLSLNLNINLVEVDNDTFEREGNILISAKTTSEPIVRTGDPASNWYNLNNAFYRNFGKAWHFDDTDQVCDWDNFATFTQPVAVEPGSEFDNGQGYHKYKIGFRNIIANPNGNVIGTNPFNLRRYYDGATVLSPAYNQMESIEFFPENGNNPLQGFVKIVAQTLVFLVEENDVEVQYTIPICGSGTYNFNSSENRWEMFVTLVAVETNIGGNISEKKMFIYNVNVAEDPPLLNEACANYFEF